MSPFRREVHDVCGIRTVVYTAGAGKPVVFLHGAGTVDGFDFAEPSTDRFRVIAPFHPGFGESDDDPALTDLHDYVLHYLELFDRLALDRVRLVGLSLGGNIAARFACEHGHRVEKLALIAPAGIIDRAHPTRDLLMVPGDAVPRLLVSDIDVLRRRMPATPDLDFIAARYRETTTMTRLLWERPDDPKFMRYLHRITMPTLIVWGDEDQVTPVGQAETWRTFVPAADIRIFKGAGHLVHLEKPEAVAAVGEFLA